MGFEKIDLLPKFQRINPVIIALAYRNVFTLRQRQHNIKKDIYTLGILICLLIHGSYNLGVSGFVFPYYSSGTVRRGIIMNKHFESESGPLRNESLQTVPNVILMIVCTTDNTDHYCIAATNRIHRFSN